VTLGGGLLVYGAAAGLVCCWFVEESAKESAGYTRSLLAAPVGGRRLEAVRCRDRCALQQIEGKTRPEGGALGDAGFNAAGWTAIREAA
jgi:hypothetical protein